MEGSLKLRVFHSSYLLMWFVRLMWFYLCIDQQGNWIEVTCAVWNMLSCGEVCRVASLPLTIYLVGLVLVSHLHPGMAGIIGQITAQARVRRLKKRISADKCNYILPPFSAHGYLLATGAGAGNQYNLIVIHNLDLTRASTTPTWGTRSGSARSRRRRRRSERSSGSWSWPRRWPR